MHSMAASKVIKEEGGENDLLERIAADSIFGVTIEELNSLLNPQNYTGRAPRQTEDFINEVVKPILSEYDDIPRETAEINV